MRLTTRSWQAALAALALAGLAAFGAARAQDGADAPAAKVPEGAEGLKDAWTEIVSKAGAGDAAAVRDLLTKMVMTEADFVAVFASEEKAKAVYARYAEIIAANFPGEADNIIGWVKEKKRDEVEVADMTAPDFKPIDAKEEADLRKLLPLLKPGTKVYRVRLKKHGEKVGSTYHDFFNINGAWKAGVRLSRPIDKVDKPAAAPPAPPKTPAPTGEEK